MRAGSRSSRCTPSTSSSSPSSGARAGAPASLSNIHLGARDPETGGFVMLGKTFKGMTDEMLAWQTQTVHRTRRRPYRRLRGAAAPGAGRRDRLRRRAAARPATRAAWRCASPASLRYRDDKRAADADTIDTVRSFVASLTRCRKLLPVIHPTV